MKKKKNRFTLIEVLIAIGLATGACFFLLEFEENYIKNARQSLIKVQKERLTQEAYVLFLEKLYTNQIPWKAMEDEKSFDFLLSDSNWNVIASFTTVSHGQVEEVAQNLMDVRALLTLYHNGKEQITKGQEIRLCLKKEERMHVQTPQT